ncbi:MAG: HEAT repeat domain-containing protein [Prochlorothrix sp.]|nr:HEAT repeat domain-containing protein [Prochlorothrix sp.]
MTHEDSFKPEETLNEDLADLDSPLDQPVEAIPEIDPEAMLALLQSPDSQQRILATRAFCELQDRRAIPPLIALLQDPCPMVRVSAAYALGRNPSETAIDPLMGQLRRDWNGYVRKGVVWAMGNCGDQRCLPLLVETLQTDIAAVRLWAASALGQLATVGQEAIVAVIQPLVEALRGDPVAVVRSNCAWALGQIGREIPMDVTYANLIDTLLDVLVQDDDLSVREDAKDSLLRVGDPRALQVIEDLEQEGSLW